MLNGDIVFVLVFQYMLKYSLLVTVNLHDTQLFDQSFDIDLNDVITWH